jgi:hypothetical protein
MRKSGNKIRKEPNTTYMEAGIAAWKRFMMHVELGIVAAGSLVGNHHQGITNENP